MPFMRRTRSIRHCRVLEPDGSDLHKTGWQTRLLVAAPLLGVLALAGCGGSGSPTSPRTLTALAITPATASVPQGVAQQFTASGTFSDGTTQDVTKTVAWSSSDPTVAAINSSGLATSLAQGTVTVIAASLGASASTTLTVGPPVSVSVSPGGVVSVTLTQTQQFQAMVSNTSNTAVSWSVDGAPGGNASAGTITSAGLYTPPQATGSHQIAAISQVDPTKSASATLVVTDYPGAFTYHNDNARTGQNLQEIVLTPANVNSAQFGKLFSYPVDGRVYAQPLYVENVSVAGQGFHNLVFVATAHDSVYAFDADGLTSTAIWQTNFLDPTSGVTAVPCGDEPGGCRGFAEIGITGTPVIDPVTQTLYVSAFTKENGNYVHRLHALDITTGAEKFGGPVVIQGSVVGTGSASVAGTVSFNPYLSLQRSGLLLTNGSVYLSFASYNDSGLYHGWLFGYDAASLRQTAILNVTPDGYAGGIWQSGSAPAADSNGNIFVATGNGTFDADTGGREFGDSILKLLPDSTGVSVGDYFTPFDQQSLYLNDADLGAGGVVLLPDQSGAHPHLLVEGRKDGTVYLVDRDDMGHFNPADDTQVVQVLRATVNDVFSVFAYWNNAVYTVGENDVLKVFALSNGLLSTAPTAESSHVFHFRGATPSISANGQSQGIVWAVDTLPALCALDASDVSRELYDSTQVPDRDTLGPSTRFQVPTVANGKVYVGTQTDLEVFGLLPQ
jgi:Bacterial Ig-like domain (group 2)